ncbi:hypothetical protein EVAR_91114_1 [Eumeta japonica]|uniref:Uncharacterized protein n=1 Tax=Eumeta variegata TaxID=151549 RepID=A0A4C1SS40_EUMVA|nr:hypothetical protein EVAR_91114_1 [Eumeta japonica]
MLEDTPIPAVRGSQSGGTRARGRENGFFWENDMSPDQGTHGFSQGQRYNDPHVQVLRTTCGQDISEVSLKEIGMRWETLNRVIPNLYSFLLESAALVWPGTKFDPLKIKVRGCR